METMCDEEREFQQQQQPVMQQHQPQAAMQRESDSDTNQTKRAVSFSLDIN